MREEKLILVLNLGSRSTKVAVFDNDEKVLGCTLEHSSEELAKHTDMDAQLEFRKGVILQCIEQKGYPVGRMAAIACRGGVIGVLEPGAYLIDEAFVEASRHPLAAHPANLTPIIGYGLAQEAGIQAYAYDVVCGCGVPDKIVTISGVPEAPRVLWTHVLNSRAVSFAQAEKDGRNIEDTAYIVSHLGGGITTNLIVGGRILDIVADDEGSFSPERAGGIPGRKLVKLCFSGQYTERQVREKLKGKGGMMAYLGTSDLRKAVAMMEQGDERAGLIIDAMALQIAKDIAALFPVVCGKVDKIILTGGMAFSKALTDRVVRRAAFAAPVEIMPGSYEMEALARGIGRVLRNEEEVHRFCAV